MELSTKTSLDRITSLDALRAVILLGILLVHSCNYFGYQVPELTSLSDKVVNRLITGFLSNRCNTIFDILFGVSFYLILRNPQNSSTKFVWRCFLLMLIGLVNKIFYTYDALMWFGVCGMLLVTLRHLKPRYLLMTAIVLFIAKIILARYRFGDLIFGERIIERYTEGASLFQIVSYKYAVIDYLRMVFNGGFFHALSWFIIGYWIAKVGVVENLEKKVTWKFVLLFWSLFIVDSIIILIFGRNRLLFSLNIIFATFAYSSVVIYAYYNCKSIRRVLNKLEPYGKMGLTNYSMQNVLGVILFTTLHLYQYDLTFIIFIFLLFYVFQAIFSYVWLSYFRYGPIEYIWRVATERRKIELKKKS